MGHLRPHPPTLLLTAVISRYDEALAWARRKLVEAWGPVVAQSETFRFDETNYYDATMGPGLGKTFLAFAGRFDATTSSASTSSGESPASPMAWMAPETLSSASGTGGRLC